MSIVRNMLSPRSGRPAANQFIIDGVIMNIGGQDYCGTVFQSYNSIIVFEARNLITGNTTTFLGDNWDYSTTTGRYRNFFLSEGIAETRENIKTGSYIRADLDSAFSRIVTKV